MRKPHLHVHQLLEWADAYRERTGEWPNLDSGRVDEDPQEKWLNIDQDLHKGLRGLPGGWSLVKLLAEFRGKRNPAALPRHTEIKILAWVDAHHDRTGRWPTFASGPIVEAAGETWSAVDMALHAGIRGLPGGSSLAKLLRQERRVRRRRKRRVRREKVAKAVARRFARCDDRREPRRTPAPACEPGVGEAPCPTQPFRPPAVDGGYDRRLGRRTSRPHRRVAHARCGAGHRRSRRNLGGGRSGAAPRDA
ncbi:MAG TPA: hypothetical protein VGX76_16565, partial [Pirellulales bacterium]|nr:hypothetical protein [Pirellulales bacterium]